MSGPSTEELIADRLKTELGVSSSDARNIASDITCKIRLSLINPKCPKCGGDFPEQITAGEKVRCKFCHSLFSAESVVDKATNEALCASEEYSKLPAQFLQKIQSIFSSSLGSMEGKLENIDATVTATISSVRETEKLVRIILDRLNIPSQLSAMISTQRIQTPMSSETAMAVGELDRALQALGTTEFQSLDLKTLIKVGNLHFLRNEYEKALSYYWKVVSVSPYNVTVWFNIGLIYMKFKDYQKAIDACKKALESKPDYTKAWILMGNAHRESNDFLKAIETNENALMTNSDDPGIWHWMGHDYECLGNHQRAQQCFERANASKDIKYYYPETGDLVVGVVTRIIKEKRGPDARCRGGWLVDINMRRSIELNAPFSLGIPPRPKAEELALILNVGDLLCAKIDSVRLYQGGRLPMLSIAETGLGKLPRDESALVLNHLRQIVRISPTAMRFLVGSEDPAITAISEETGCDMLVGPNGIAVITGKAPRDVELATVAIRKIEDGFYARACDFVARMTVLLREMKGTARAL